MMIKFIKLLLILFLCILIVFILYNNSYKPSIAVTQNGDKALELLDFVNKFGYNATISKKDSFYILWLNVNNKKDFDYITIALAKSDIMDSSVQLGVMYRSTDNINQAEKRISKSLASRLKKVDSVVNAEVNVSLNKKKLIEVNIETYDTDVIKLRKTISNLIPLSDDEKIINITVIKN